MSNLFGKFRFGCEGPPRYDGNSWWTHVKFLADDSLEGRNTGSEGLKKAQAYAVEQLQKAGLEPAGVNGFYQPVCFTQFQVDESKSSLTLVAKDQSIPLSFTDDAFISSRATRASVHLGAPLVFVGYGLKIPEKNLDELAGLSLNGKVVVYIAGSPAEVPTALASAEKLFAGSGHTFAEIAALGKDRKPLPHFPLAVSLQASAIINSTAVESANLVGKLPGTDPTLKNELVVLSAHLDHVGIGAPINGDNIYNGAMDNGSGSALVMDIAASLKEHPEAAKRSILFLLVTAEEKGLLGSKYFAARPTVPIKSVIADVNVDMFLPIVPLKVLKIEGIDESDLGSRAAAIAQSMGIKPIADPEPLRNSFVRSDQYSFIRHGIPSLKMDVSFELGSPEQKIFKDWLTNRYHAPSDDVNQPVDLETAARYEEFTLRLLLETANDAARPQWKPDSFFRRYAMN